MRQHERRLVLHIEFAGEGEHALALHLVTERGDGKQIGPQRQLVPSEQGARGDGEITMARLAAPPWMGCRSRARVEQIVQPQPGQTGLPSVSGQRKRRNTFSTPRSDMRMILAALSERAAAESRKCCAMVTTAGGPKPALSCQRLPKSTTPNPSVASAT